MEQKRNEKEQRNKRMGQTRVHIKYKTPERKERVVTAQIKSTFFDAPCDTAAKKRLSGAEEKSSVCRLVFLYYIPNPFAVISAISDKNVKNHRHRPYIYLQSNLFVCERERVAEYCPKPIYQHITSRDKHSCCK